MHDFENRAGFRVLPRRDGHRCFACGPENPYGLQMQFWTDEEAVYSKVSIPSRLCGWETMAHGGITATVLDEIMGWAGIYLLKRYVVTRTLTVKYLKPLYIGDEIVAVGQVSKQLSTRKAVMRGWIYKDNGIECANSTGEYGLFTPEAILRAGILDKERVERFQAYLEM